MSIEHGTLMQAFTQAGYDIYLVGGSVRDQLLGLPAKDRDYCTSARPEQTLALLAEISPVKPHRVGEKWGTIGVGDVEVTTFRGEVYRAGNRKPTVYFSDSLQEDLARRDFTFNAIAQDINGTLIDPFGGLEDLAVERIRCVGDAAERFREDPLRMLRAIRFVATIKGGWIESKTRQALHARRREILSISRERMRDELNKLLVGGSPAEALWMLRDTGLMAFVAPELHLLDDQRRQGKYHHLNVWEHTVRVVGAVPNTLVLRLAALLHDVGKSATRTETYTGSGDEVHFHGHEDVGAMLAQTMLARLRYDKAIIERVCRLVREHMRVNTYDSSWKDGAVRRLVADLGEDLPLAIDLARADQINHLGASPWRADQLAGRITRLAALPHPTPLPVNGRDIMTRYHLPPGRHIGTSLQLLRDAVLEGDIAPDDQEAAWRILDCRIIEEIPC